MQKPARATLLVMLFTLLGLMVAFATQVVTASFFGAGAGMDAFLAASAVPQYVIAVLLGSLSFVFVPVFVDCLVTGSEEEAWQLASSVINLCLLVLCALVALGILFPDVILHVIVPGVPVATRQQAVQIARITWPSVLATGVVSLLTGIYQAQARFAWPAAVPVIGAIVSLGLVIAWAHWLGILGLAIATTAGIVLQVGLLLPLALRRGRYRLMLNWRHPAVWQVMHLLLPLVLANMVAKLTPLIERFLASGMPEGSISHLGYAFRILTVLSVLISTGIATVAFPRMAVNATNGGFYDLRCTVSACLRLMWLAIAPAIAIGIALAFPMIAAVLQRGKFGTADAVAVAALLQVYLLSLPGGTLGSITGRTFYVLKDTRTVAIYGSIESVLYVVYTALLARFLGAVGVALGYALFLNGSLLWQVIVLHYKTGNTGGRTVLSSFGLTGLAALLCGVASWSATMLTTNLWGELILGGAVGLSTYLLALWMLNSREVRAVLSILGRSVIPQAA
jgi:putative peptidoglycan lipid II flippase